MENAESVSTIPTRMPYAPAFNKLAVFRPSLTVILSPRLNLTR